MSLREDWDRWALDERTKYFDRLTHDAFEHCCSILIGCPHRPTTEAFSGSGILICIEEHSYVLTADHVVQGLAAKREAGEPAHFQIGALTINPHERIVYADKDHDVAVLAIDEAELPQVACRPYRPTGDWPPLLPAQGTCVLLNGFASRNRTNGELGKVEVTSLHFTARVDQPRDRHFYARIERGGEPTEHVSLMPPPDESLGGMSGGPVLMFSEAGMLLVGIISQAFQMLDAVRVSALCGVHLPTRQTINVG
jgi:Trypsin-like peptidase domain